MSEDVARLGQHVVWRRNALLLSQIDVWKRGGPSNSTLTGLESGTASTVSPSTLKKLDRALGWTEGSARTVLNGGEPTVAEPDVDHPDFPVDTRDIAQLLDRLLTQTDQVHRDLRHFVGPEVPVTEHARSALEAAMAVAVHIFGGYENVSRAAEEVALELSHDGTVEVPATLFGRLQLVIESQVLTNSMWGGAMLQARQTETAPVREYFSDPDRFELSDEQLGAPDGRQSDYDLANRMGPGKSQGAQLRDAQDADAEGSQADPNGNGA